MRMSASKAADTRRKKRFQLESRGEQYDEIIRWTEFVHMWTLHNSLIRSRATRHMYCFTFRFYLLRNPQSARRKRTQASVGCWEFGTFEATTYQRMTNCSDSGNRAHMFLRSTHVHELLRKTILCAFRILSFAIRRMNTTQYSNAISMFSANEVRQRQEWVRSFWVYSAVESCYWANFVFRINWPSTRVEVFYSYFSIRRCMWTIFERPFDQIRVDSV